MGVAVGGGGRVVVVVVVAVVAAVVAAAVVAVGVGRVTTIIRVARMRTVDICTGIGLACVRLQDVRFRV